MKILPLKDYGLAIDPLRDVKINNLFARSVVERHVTGRIFVDNLHSPKIFYVVHPYGMSLLYGDISGSFIRSDLRDYVLNRDGLGQKEWLQVYPAEYAPAIEAMLGDVLAEAQDDQHRSRAADQDIRHTRVNFTFNPDRFACLSSRAIPAHCELQKTDETMFREMNGHVVPQKFWDSYDDFAQRGMGFSLVMNGEPITTAFSSFVHDNLVELGMETKPQFRKQGFAHCTCSRLITYCLERGYEPVWACRLGNSGSYNLALKLGFEPARFLPYYELKDQAESRA